ncbi:hypothetical protein FQN54_002857 [Arachnomyces sp. PD_36]|nr:hypothetical protein FQN54_002857 [Arachnomyces sp. PD_36]
MEESPPFRYTGQPLSYELIASISNAFDLAGIPSVLWGAFPMIIHGVGLVQPELDFVVSDEDLDRAYEVVLARGFPPCSVDNCRYYPESDWYMRGYPAAPKHLHLNGDEDNVLLLHRKSERLWAVPTFEPLSHKEHPEAKIILASDPVLPPWNIAKCAGAFPDTLPPVRIPSAHFLVEALLRLAVHYFIDENSTEPFSGQWIGDAALFEDEYRKRCQPVQDQYMDPRYRDFFKAFLLEGGRLQTLIPLLKQPLESPADE